MPSQPGVRKRRAHEGGLNSHTGISEAELPDGYVSEAWQGSSEEGHMCPVCIASTAVMVAGAGSTGGILAVCIGKFRKFFRANRLGLFQKSKGEIRWQQAKRETRNTRKDISR